MLSLWVWEDVLCDYTCGIAFAFAETEEQAWEELRKHNHSHCEQIEEEGVKPKQYTSPIGFTVHGGG